jgi:DNA transformation protein
MTKLCNAQNIGKVLELKLNKVGISSLEELKTVGAETAFAKVKGVDHNAGRSTLFSLDGAISGVAWHKLNECRKDELRKFFGELGQKN